jgi:hypothetical protein
MSTKRAILPALVAALALIGAAAVSIGVAGTPDNSPKSTFSLEQARQFDQFPVYYAGTEVAEIPLVAVLRRNESANYVSFIYGRCHATSDMGCAPPAEVQVWPACVRNLSRYKALTPLSPRYEPQTVRGATTGVFDDGTRLEIQTGTSTVVVFAKTAELADQVAAALRGVNVDTRAGEKLPPPAPGAVNGTLSCRT